MVGEVLGNLQCVPLLTFCGGSCAVSSPCCLILSLVLREIGSGLAWHVPMILALGEAETGRSL